MAIQLSKQHFWQWFLRHNEEYLLLHQKSQKELKYWKNELSAHLRAYYKFLYFSLQVSKDHTSGVLAISVSGKAKYFRYVDAIVAVAPAIPGWTIQALEPPRAIDAFWEEEVGHSTIDPHELWCSVSQGENPPTITVYHTLYTTKDKWLFELAARTAVYNVLGERSFGLDIEEVTADNLSCAPRNAELIKVEDLPAYLPLCKSGMVVDAAGGIWEQ